MYLHLNILVILSAHGKKQEKMFHSYLPQRKCIHFMTEQLQITSISLFYNKKISKLHFCTEQYMVWHGIGRYKNLANNGQHDSEYQLKMKQKMLYEKSINKSFNFSSIKTCSHRRLPLSVLILLLVLVSFQVLASIYLKQVISTSIDIRLTIMVVQSLNASY